MSSFYKADCPQCGAALPWKRARHRANFFDYVRYPFRMTCPSCQSRVLLRYARQHLVSFLLPFAAGLIIIVMRMTGARRDLADLAATSSVILVVCLVIWAAARFPMRTTREAAPEGQINPGPQK